MSWGFVAVGVSSVVGAGLSYLSADKAADQAKASADAQMAFERQRLAEWEATYGGLEDNLSDYYSTLTPEYYEAVGLENQQAAFQESQTRLNETLAIRGLDNSGISASLESQAGLANAEQRAEIRRDAPRAVAEDKARFLQIGLGQNPSNSMANTLANESNYARNQAGIAEQQAGQAIGNAISTVGTGVADYLARPAVIKPSVQSTPSYVSSAPSHIPQAGGVTK